MCTSWRAHTKYQQRTTVQIPKPAPAMAHTQNQITTPSVQLAFPQAQVRLDAACLDEFPELSVDEVGNLCFGLFVGKRQIDHNSIPGNRVTGQPGSLPYAR